MSGVQVFRFDGPLYSLDVAKLLARLATVPASAWFITIDSVGEEPGDERINEAIALLMGAFQRCMDRCKPLGVFIEHAEGESSYIALGCLELFIQPGGTLGGMASIDDHTPIAERHRRVELSTAHHRATSRRTVSRLLRGDVLTADELVTAGMVTLATDEDHALQMFKQRLREIYAKEVV